MTDSDLASLERRILLLAPTGRDAGLTASILERAGLTCLSCPGMSQLCDELEAGAGAVLVAEEAMPGSDQRLLEWLSRQPPWSDMPFVILARPGADSGSVNRSLEVLGNVSVLERPLRIATLVSAARAALRARARQYDTRSHLTQMERSERDLSDFFENATVGLHWVGPEGTILRANQTELAMLGYTRDEYVGHNIAEFHADPEVIQDILRRLVAGEVLSSYEARMRRKDGAIRNVVISSNVLWENGYFIHTRCFTRDITERKQAEEALRQADRNKDEFLAVLAHELRNPLAPIRNSLHILRLTEGQDSSMTPVVGMMERQVNHMVRLVDDLMEISRISRGKIELRQECLSVTTVLANAVETSRPLIDAARHHLTVSVPDTPIPVSADPVRLSQVISNLLNNAANYTPPGGEIHLAARTEAGEAVLTVRDNGEGIEPEMLPKIFELFTQIERRSGNGGAGLGIGLSLVKTLVSMHGGTIAARSEGSGHGSEFEVRLPLAPASQPIRPGGDGTPVGPLEVRRILVVDDNRDAAQSLATLLQLLGADVQVAHDGAEALEVLPRYRPAAVLMDLGMPGMDGLEVARRIRQCPEFREVKLIALTGWGQAEDRRRSEQAGFDFHLIKPADIDSLQQLLGSMGGTE